MKISKLMTASMVGVMILTTEASFASANASKWYKGIPSFAKVNPYKPWMSTKKFDKKNGYYYRQIIFADNNGVGNGFYKFHNNGKGVVTIGGGAPIIGYPYYKKIGSNTYEVKSTKNIQDTGKNLVKFQKSGKKVKAWVKYSDKSWEYVGPLKRVKLENVYKTDPLK
ncbi:hypothetical protein MOO44_01140 (plasmid) [Nicoliella spurrieriana]|uniref:Uncharacterized protein n=1 Tax=Nicoliella spurrieriana TaxID=2925830 RepID=A0A976RQF6_9LACO|nr:hypothetical protein [Nicoliella spurrieriana]UQS85955.1 hypothetical protein MOO44_01140 [Nicoliella spurrieriana]